jgi:amino acid permease
VVLTMTNLRILLFSASFVADTAAFSSAFAPSLSLHTKATTTSPLFGPTTLLYSTDEASAQPLPPAASEGGGTATVSQEIFNLVKSIVGAGVLTLPAGIAAFGNAPSAVIPAIGLIAVIGCLSSYGFALIGRVCSLTGTGTFRSAWSASISEETSWIPAWSVTLKTVFATLAYSMILGDTFQSLLLTAGVSLSKTTVLTAVTAGILLPLCLLKNLSSLAPFSLLGSLGMIYTCIAMGLRYFSGDYLKGGKFALDTAAVLRPTFGTLGAGAVWSPKSAILLGVLSTSYMAHFNAPKFYTELKNNTVPRYLAVVWTSFAASILLYCLMATFGFLTFGAASSGLILNNYSIKDSLMGISRIAVALSIVFSYPLAFVGARDGILDLFRIKNRSDSFLNSLTVAMLSALTVAALSIPDVSFVLSFAGSTLGNALIYVFPALMFKSAIAKKSNPTKLQKAEVKFALTSAVLGIVMGTIGAIKAVQSVLLK